MAEDLEDSQPQGGGEDLSTPQYACTEASDPAPTGVSAESPGFLFNMWPPTQRTREAVICRLVGILTSASPFTKRYGTLSSDEAEESARAIEEEAFAAASSAAVVGYGPDGVGCDSVDAWIERLQVYSKKVSHRVLEFAKARASKSFEGSEVASESPAV